MSDDREKANIFVVILNLGEEKLLPMTDPEKSASGSEGCELGIK
ncbi:MAG TPA: hypothetical protein VEC16_01770 [Alphaproteobacteria bacterium]|nr:hypothetical protein [Alphaproteobacteria bacterium]